MGRRIGRYVGKNRLVERDDIKQEFMIGVAMYIHRAKLDMGDPIAFIISKGVFRVRDYMRKHIRQGTMQICKLCGNKTRLNKVGDRYTCTICGNTEVDTFEVADHDEITLENIAEEGFEDYVISDIVMARFEETLIPGTNVHSLYQMLKSGIDRDNPEVKNYIKEIARIWGGCSDQNVVQHLDKLRNRMRKYFEDNMLECYIY